MKELKIRLNRLALFGVVANLLAWVDLVDLAYCDPPIDRIFLNLPDQRWIRLKKTGWETTKIMLGARIGSTRPLLWTRHYTSDEQRCWAYAFFVYIKPHKFSYDLDQDGDPEVGIATYDLGNNMNGDILIYTVRRDSLELFAEYGPVNLGADDIVFEDE